LDYSPTSPPHPHIRYLRDPQKRTTGDKRNRLCAEARGRVIVHWDDDDWHAPDRLDRQLAALDATGAAIVGLDRIAFLADDGSAADTAGETVAERGSCPCLSTLPPSFNRSDPTGSPR